MGGEDEGRSIKTRHQPAAPIPAIVNLYTFLVGLSEKETEAATVAKANVSTS